MADRIISAEVRISGQDAGVAEMLSKVAANIKRVDEIAGQSGQMQKLGRQMAELKGQMEAVGRLKTVETNLGAMQARAAEAAARVEKLKVEMAGVATPTAAMARAMESAEVASVKAAAAVVRQTEAFERNRRAVAEMGLSTANAVREQERLARSFQDTARAAEITMRAEQRAEQAAAHFARTSHGAGHGHGGGLDIGGVVAGVLAGHSVLHGAEIVGEVYRHFDKERRYGAVVMNLTPEQQAPLIEQAIHGGATSKFNDIQWLESQRELAMRGYNKDQVLGFTPIVAQIGQAFDVSMPEAVKALEGAMLGFGKDVSTFEKASAAATRTADLEVKASKISGMSFEDVVQLYKVGAAPARMAHLSEESLLAFGAISKKSNMGGEESSIAFRALAKNLLSPTADAKTAMLANGIDYSRFQKAPKAIDLGAFVRDVAMKYGVVLNDASKAGLARIFADPKMLGDPARFVPAVTHVLKETLGKQDAKSSKAIAGDARKFRDDSVGGVDTDGLMTAIMEGISKSPALANAIFGSKQGGRIYAALGDPKFYHHILDELHNESGGFAKKVSEERMAGFDGAASKFEGAVKNFETAISRAFDDGGKGGFLTKATEGAAHFVQTLAEADPHLLQIGAAAAGLTGLWGSAKMVGLFSGGFGLKGSAEALDGSALALKEAAGAIAGGHGAPSATPGEGGKPGKGGSTFGGPLGFLGGALAMLGFAEYAQGEHALEAPKGLSGRDVLNFLDPNFGNLFLGKEGATPPVPLPPDRYAYTAPNTDGNALRRWEEVGPQRASGAAVPPPEVAESFRLLPPAVHAAADALDRLKDRDEAIRQGKDELDQFNFVVGQLGDSAGRAALALASLASYSGGAGAAGGGSGLIQAAYHPDEDGFGGGGGAGSSPLRRGAAPRERGGRGGGSGSWAPSPGDPVFVGARDASGFDWAHMGVQMAAKAAYLGNHLQAIGSTEIAAAAMLGHASVESNFKVDAHNGRQEDSHGLFQLNDSARAGHRYSRYLAWARANRRAPNDPLAQLDYAKVESMRMRGPGGRSVWDAMQRAGSLAEANRIWMDYFEAPKHRDYGNRLRQGQHALDAMQALGGRVPREHPALAAPPLPRRAPGDPHGDGGTITAHHELVGAVRKMTAAVERGGLHRIEIKPHRSLVARKVYQRGSTGTTVA